MEGGKVAQSLGFAAGPPCGLGDLEGKSLVQALAARVAQAPQGRFWSLQRTDRPRSRSHVELWDRSGRMAADLIAKGLPHGSLVVLALEDGLDFVPSFWACLRAGYVAVPLSGAMLEARSGDRARVFAEALEALSPRLAIIEEKMRDDVLRGAPSCLCVVPEEIDGREPLAEDAPSADLAYVLATSGSTGKVKLVAVSGRTLMYNTFKVPDPAMVDAGACINTFPVHSTSGLSCVIMAHREFVHLPMDVFARDPASLFDAIETYRSSYFSITNTMAGRVVDAVTADGRRWDLSSLRRVGIGAEVVLPSTVRRLDEVLRRFGASSGLIRAGYGMTETGALLTGADPLAADLVGGLGVPLGTPAPNVAIRVVDQAGSVMPEGTVGEVEIHAPLKMFSFYWGDPEATARGFTADGWWRTGDTGLLWGGQLALRGRTKDVFISNGHKHALGAIDEVVRDALGPGEAAYACTIPSRDGQAETLGVALVASPGCLTAIKAIRQAVGQAFGLPITVIRSVPSSTIPLTSTGKVKRLALAALLSGPEPTLDDAPAAVETTEIPTPAGKTLALIWEAVLGPGSARDPHADYFALGGDSLRLLEMFSRVERDAGVAVEPRLFFARPTLATLLNLVEVVPSKMVEPDPATPDVWPLTADQYWKQLVLTETWCGDRPTVDRLLMGFNAKGSRPPIFLVCQDEHEVRELARHLGSDQPVFGLRSGFMIIEHRDDEVQAFALRYVANIQTLYPKGPVLLAGICQGGVIALAMAQHLLRRRRHVPLLVLMEWPTSLHPYPGRVLFIYAEASLLSNPYLRFREPERGWRRNHLEVEAVAVPGDHWGFLRPENMPRTAAILAESFDRALSLPAYHLANEHYQANVGVGPLPPRIEVGQTFAVKVSVTNTSATPWTETAYSGLMLGYRWIDAAGEAIEPRYGRSTLPAMAPDAPLEVLLIVTAPASAGRVSLVIDVVEEGSSWFCSRHPEGAACTIVDILKGGD